MEEFESVISEAEWRPTSPEVPGRKRFGDETEYGSASSLPEISKGIRIV